MQRNSRALGSEDFDRFSKFLRSTPSRVMPCNSENSGGSVANSQINNNNNSSHGKSLAMVYPVKQNWQSIYDPEIALYNGTVFEELDKPFERSGCSQNNGCRGNTREGGCYL